MFFNFIPCSIRIRLQLLLAGNRPSGGRAKMYCLTYCGTIKYDVRACARTCVCMLVRVTTKHYVWIHTATCSHHESVAKYHCMPSWVWPLKYRDDKADVSLKLRLNVVETHPSYCAKHLRSATLVKWSLGHRLNYHRESGDGGGTRSSATKNCFPKGSQENHCLFVRWDVAFQHARSSVWLLWQHIRVV